MREIASDDGEAAKPDASGAPAPSASPENDSPDVSDASSGWMDNGDTSVRVVAARSRRNGTATRVDCEAGLTLGTMSDSLQTTIARLNERLTALKERL